MLVLEVVYGMDVSGLGEDLMMKSTLGLGLGRNTIWCVHLVWIGSGKFIEDAEVGIIELIWMPLVGAGKDGRDVD